MVADSGESPLAFIGKAREREHKYHMNEYLTLATATRALYFTEPRVATLEHRQGRVGVQRIAADPGGHNRHDVAHLIRLPNV